MEIRADESKSLTIHIGLPKTASTYLQKVVFPGFLSHEEFAFGERAKKMLQSEHHLPSSVKVLSAEAWSNSLLAGGYENNFCRFIANLNNVKRRKVKILFFVRNHEDWLVSSYLQLAKASYWKPKTFRKYIQSFGDCDLSWARRIEDLSGQKTLICEYEAFRKNKEFWVQEIVKFMGGVPLDMKKLKNSEKKMNATPNTMLSLWLARGLALGTEFPDLTFKKVFGRRLIFGGNSRADFARVWVRDALIHLADELPGSDPLKEKLEIQIPQSMRTIFEEDRRAIGKYLAK